MIVNEKLSFDFLTKTIYTTKKMEDKLKLMNKIRVFFKKDKNNFSSCTYVEEKHWKQKNMCFCLY